MCVCVMNVVNVSVCVAPLDGHVPAVEGRSGGGGRGGVGAAGGAQVGVALPHAEVARTLLGVTLGLAAATGEAVLTYKSGCIILIIRSLLQ